ncbi:hypothetical protein C8A00DRAFT_31471 [Chaetomidium leptoderma]|uniref:Chromo domain-containing protein n=1 Tax=Chaetomidium leptoderma TaxID=669021 RepID=A0AAN6VQ30_9PEZI|nr:hypothetical protein C8A00DRAFT_31471 [Chaetomidium leptoderma]
MNAPDPHKPSPPEDPTSSLLDQQRLTSPNTDRRWTKGGGRFGALGGQSLYVHRYFLVGMALLFMLFVAALEALNYVSSRDEGFVPAPGGMHYYLWTYGPAFVFTTVATTWSQLEYRVQILVPWTQLARAPLPATGNLLLNYVTPWGPKSLAGSLSARHFAVSLGIFGGIISKALIVVSTGLLTSETKQLNLNIDFRMVDQFNLSVNAGNYFLNSLADTGVALWAITQKGVPYRPGATPEHAALSFIPTDMDLEPGATLSANVSVFSVDQECTSFSWTYPTGFGNNEWFSLADIMPQSDFDQLSPFCVWFPLWSNQDPNPSLTNNVSSRHINNTVMVDFDCPNQSISPPPSDSLRLFTSVGLQSLGNVSTVSAVLCHPTYSLTRRQVTTSWGNSTGGTVLAISNDILDDIDLGIAPSVLTDDILRSMGGYEYTLAPRGGLPFWAELMNLTTPQSDWEAFANTTLLSAAFQRTFRTLAALAVKYTKTGPAAENQSVPGRITYATPRLVVTAASLRAVEALLVVLALVALLLSLDNFRPLPRQPPSLMTAATVLAENDRLAETLRMDQVPRLETLAMNLRGYLFSSSQDLRTIQVHDDPPSDDHQRVQAKGVPLHDPEEVSSKWWRPASATLTFRIPLIVTTLLLFVALEVVYQISNKNGGFADISTEGYTRYLWLYLPPFLMAGLGLAYGAMDTAARTLHPFSQLSRGADGNGDAMEFDPRSSPALIAVAETLYRRSFGLSAIISTSVLAGLLTIAASGLYVAEHSVPETESVSLGLESWFDIQSGAQNKGTGGINDALINQAIYFNNMSSPAGAYGEFAFAMPETSGLGVYNAFNSSATLRARVPAVQTQANCSLFRFWDSIEIGPRDSTYGFSLDVTPPLGCERGPSQKLSDGRFLSLAQGAGLTPPPGYFGFVSNLWWKLLPNATGPDGTYSPDTRTPYTVCSDDTQHLFIIYGRRIDLTMHNVTLLHCLPFVQAVEIEADFSLPDLTIDDSISAPAAIGPPTPWDSPIRSRNSIPLPEIAADESEGVDPFFTVLTRGGRDATPLDSLVGGGGSDRTDAMIARINAVYAQLGAQALNLHFRRPMANLTSTSASSTAAAGRNHGRPSPPGSGRLEGTVSVPAPLGRGRLVQTEVSTRLLEGLLLCLAVCGSVSFWVLRGTEKLLPADPGSIAARMALLAGTFSDDEEPSDQFDQTSAKRAGRVKNPASYEDEDLEEEQEDAVSADDKNGNAAADEDEAGDDDEDMDDEVFVVEKIMSHMIDNKGTPLYEVKWEGYEKKSDRTWEPEENLVDNASEALNEYLESIGGREKLLDDSANALKSKKRGRASTSASTPQASGKRSKRNGDHPADSEPPLSTKEATWKPPPGSWEDHIANLDACEDEESGKLMVYLSWKNGHKTQHTTSVIYQRCPQKMLQFYERHVRIIKRDADAESVENSQ